MRSAAPLFTVATVTIVCAVAGPVHADPDPRKAAVKLIAQGDRLFKKRDFAGALAKYQAAYQVFPSPKIFYAMAKAEAELGRALDAIAHYQQFLVEAGDEVNEDLRVDAQLSIQELDRSIAQVSFEVGPAGVTIQVDDSELGASPHEPPLRLLPGEHIYHFSKPGYLTVVKTVTLAAGERPHETITLAPAAAPEPAVTRPALEPAAEATPPARSRLVLWTGVGVTSALAVGWLVSGAMAIQDHGDFLDAGRSPDERAAARDRGKAMALTSDLLLVGALATGSFTAWWYLQADGTTHEPTHVTHVLPYVAPGGGGLAVMGGF